MSFTCSYIHNRFDTRPAPRLLELTDLARALDITPPHGDWDGPALCAARFKPDGRRVRRDVTCVGALIYDLDGPTAYDKRKGTFVDGLGARPTPRHLALWRAAQGTDPLEGMLERVPLPGVYYTTWSHGWAKAWAYRLILPLEGGLDPDSWRILWGTVFELLGGEQAGLDARCSDPCRLFFLPRLSSRAQALGLPTPYEAGRIEACQEASARVREVIKAGVLPWRTTAPGRGRVA